MWFSHGWLGSGVDRFWFDGEWCLKRSGALSEEEYKLVMGHNGGGETDSVKLLTDKLESEHPSFEFEDVTWSALYSSLVMDDTS